MYYDDCTYRRGNKTYRRDLLRQSRRVGGKVVKTTVANITDWPEPLKAAIRQALPSSRKPGRSPQLPATSGLRSVGRCIQGKSMGALWLLHQMAGILGIKEALGDNRNGRLALWQIIARTINQGSRLAAVRLAREQVVAEVLNPGRFDEDDLYANLDWLSQQQAQIEDALFRRRYADGTKPRLFLYDVTSSYFEGQCNEYAAFGYNRDGKKGKKQLVVGALTDELGWPLSVEVFRGNTNDPATVAAQIEKLAERFGGGPVTLVGDRGMLKSYQTEDLAAHGMHYITAITRPQIDALLSSGTIQLDLFDELLAEVEDPQHAVRYVLRRNPAQAARTTARRQDQLATWRRALAARQTYLDTHPRARPETALRTLSALAKRLKLDTWLRVKSRGRRLREKIDDHNRREQAKLDGCYVLKTDLTREQASGQTVDARYRDLAYVERQFRTSKTGHLEQRPIYVRKARRTRGHVLVVMLSFLLVKTLAERWRDLDYTVEDGIRFLRELCVITIDFGGGRRLHEVPQPRDSVAQLLAAAQVQLPSMLPEVEASVDTKRKLPSRRN